MSNETPAADSYLALARIVREQGFYEKAAGHVLLEFAVHLTLHLGGIAVFVTAESLWLEAAALLVSAYGGLGVATNTHTSSHNATCRRNWINRGLTYFGYTFLFGTSAHYWWNKHCVVHHPAPNVVEVDDDIDLMPFFALNERELSQSRGVMRRFYRLQWILAPFALALNTFFTAYQGWRYLLGILGDRTRRRREHWFDLGVIALHWAAWVLVPMLYFAPADVLAFYLIRSVLMGYAMFIAFAPAHFPVEAALIDKSLLERDYVLRQTATTVNFRTGFFGRLVCGGVDYQIEHHLFPGVPHVRYPELAQVVEAFCRSNGYPYRTLGWWDAAWKSLAVFYRPKKVIDELDGSVTPP